MSSLLRQLVTVLVVTIVSASFAISSAKAAMALECEITSVRAVSDTVSNQLAALNQDNPGHDDIAAETESAAHQHQGHAEDHDASKDAHASHCKAHACPSTALPPFNNVMPATDVGQTLAVIQPESLVELTIPEGLRRPPRG
ncbi:hypothetical protein [Paracoccus fontiphilus]|uniref:Secreted protein n=1 Tax=Paracoccus fontiphilus TaxID=1815556 RepID=A0ABV7IFX1_9RHOB|nr:hypothetical protein [Paracoccus fontiphilus]